MSGLFKTKVPKPPKAVLMPDPADPKVRDMQRLDYLAARKRSGSAAYKLAKEDDSYSGTLTGRL